MLRLTLFEVTASPVLLALWFALDQSSLTRWLQLPAMVIVLSGWFALRAAASDRDPRWAALNTGAVVGAGVEVLQFFAEERGSSRLVVPGLLVATFRGAILGLMLAAIPIVRQLFPRDENAEEESPDSSSAP